jgi:hypothetical protein
MRYSSPIFLHSLSLYALKIIMSMLSNEHALTICSVAYGGESSSEPKFSCLGPFKGTVA